MDPARRDWQPLEKSKHEIPDKETKIKQNILEFWVGLSLGKASIKQDPTFHSNPRIKALLGKTTHLPTIVKQVGK